MSSTAQSQVKQVKTEKTDFLVIGSGLAGLAFALEACALGKVTIVTKSKASLANTALAQGGIASVMSEEDTFTSHADDTLRAGAGLCNINVVEDFVRQGPDRIRDLIRWGVRFDFAEDGKTFDLTREGAHSFRRVVHFEDHTGGEVHRALLARCLQTPNIEIVEEHFAIDLILNKQADPADMSPNRCIGAYILDRHSREVRIFLAKATVLSTGGAGKVYLYTSNWSGATGDGVAMAYRAGARISNLEFMQFHPTVLFHHNSRNFLVSEALRGEGGELVNAKGEAFMKKYHELGSLAPRDIVARGIDAEIKKSGAACVYLDMRKHNREFLKSRFPVIFQRCLEFGIDMSKDPIPVVPAAHYLCGGVVTNKNGQSDIESLWVLGETACTGFHGANRLASNSLLECLAMAHNCAQELSRNVKNLKLPEKTPRSWEYPVENSADELIVITHMWEEIRTLMWNYVGIVRTNKRLERASHRLKNILSEVKDYYSNFRIHPDIIELRNIAIVAQLTVECALRRHESRGIHYNTDYPSMQTQPKDTIVFRGLD
jgi:L-aspartate oxidase